MNTIKPIETRYRGYRFRSRLEARWAVFFDALKLNWQYEVEGYDLGPLGWYLPDFTITTPYGTHYYEIKPKNKTDEDLKFNGFINAIKPKEDIWFDIGVTQQIDGSVLHGDPIDVVFGDGDGIRRICICPRCGLIRDYKDKTQGDHHHHYCEYCDFNTPSGGENPEEESIIFPGVFYSPHKGDIMLSYFSDKVISSSDKYWGILGYATYLARSARFEHGESP